MQTRPDPTGPTPRPDPELVAVLGLDQRPGRRRNWIIITAVVAAGVLASVLMVVLGRGSGPDLPRFETAEVKRTDLVASVTATGRLAGLNTVDVGAVSGRVVELNVDYNDPVTKGMVLAKIDPEQLQAAVGQASAQLAVAEANIELAKATVVESGRTLQRTLEQSQQGLVSTSAVEAAQAASTRANATLASATANATLARATLTSARSRLSRAAIVSPIDGLVLARFVDAGQTVTAGFQTPVLFTLAADLNHMVLYIDIDEADVGRVAENQEASFVVDAYPDRVFPSRLVKLRNNPTVSANVVTYQAVLEVHNDRGLLRPGMTATATIVTATVKDALVVTNAALRFSPPRPQGPFRRDKGPGLAVLTPGEHRVWLDEGAEPKPVTVKTGATDGTWTEVLSGALQVGQRVIVNTGTSGSAMPADIAIAAAPPLITLERVGKTYGSGQSSVTALSDVDLRIFAGELVTVMGTSGSGKSTCLNVLGCLDRPTTGRYFFRGVDVGSLNLDQLALLRRHYIGFVFQGFNLLARTTALENVELPLVYRRVPAAERRRRALAALHSVGLQDREHHAPSELSGGQQQRVAIARALVSNPSLILADEPTGNVDSARQEEIMKLLVELNRNVGITMIIVTHEADVAAFTDRVIYFVDGRIGSDAPRRHS